MSLSHDYDIKGPVQFKDTVPRRRSAFHGLPLIETSLSQELADEAAVLAGQPGWQQVSMFEGPKRPIPHVASVKAGLQVKEKYDSYIPSIIEAALAFGPKSPATFPKSSRLGWPIFKVVPDKAATILDYAEVALDPEWLNDSFVTCNIRLQPEDVAKKREFNFLSGEGVAYAEEHERVPSKSGRVPARTRLVYAYPITNNLTQIVDNVIHEHFLSKPVFSHNMNGWSGRRIPFEHFRFLDVSHMERYTGLVAENHARAVGGLYASLMLKMLALPFLCPSDDWKSGFLVRPTPSGDKVLQLGSGVSIVSTIQKELMTALYLSFHNEELGSPLNFDEFARNEGRFFVLNYGDDNVIAANDKGIVDALFDYLAQFIPVEDEVPARFLGWEYDMEHGFRVGLSTMVKMFFRERAPYSFFRPYPVLGRKLAREFYRTHNHGRTGDELLDFEQRQSERHAVYGEYKGPDALAQALNDETYASGTAGDVATLEALEKDYILTPQQRLDSRKYFGFSVELTRDFFNKLVTKG
jgi:hypothetical protein